ncbi:hypothetical protein F5B20DRAFT_530940 [Whalleya microplaca]|nr:hypothetical protein F5B20DRAFT_530940 [Whalleya microplaca]
MPPRRKGPVPAEAGSGTEVDFGSDFNFPSPSGHLPQGLQNIEKWKSRRSEIRKNIAADHAKGLGQLKKGIAKHYKDEAQKRTTHNAQLLTRLIAALEKRTAAEEAINERVEWLREESAYMAKLVIDVYDGRMEKALEAAKAVEGQDAGKK